VKKPKTGGRYKRDPKSKRLTQVEKPTEQYADKQAKESAPAPQTDEKGD